MTQPKKLQPQPTEPEPTRTVYRVDRWDAAANCWAIVRVGIPDRKMAESEARAIIEGGDSARVYVIMSAVVFHGHPTPKRAGAARAAAAT